jgi:hypothetical protein
VASGVVELLAARAHQRPPSVDARLVDVVAPLERVDEPQDVVDLLDVPSLRVGPAARVRVNLRLAGGAIWRRHT